MFVGNNTSEFENPEYIRRDIMQQVKSIELFDVINQRRSVNVFDPNGTISKEDIEKIIEVATMAPSSYNLQHWHFLVVTDKELKLTLKKVAYDQQKVEDAAAAILVLGNVKAHERANLIADDLSEKGYLPAEYKDKVVQQIQGLYGNEAMQRDEAIRGASLAAMNLMLAAKGLGYGTCPMIGFDPEGARKEFNIPSHLIPVMLITIGPAKEETQPRKMRLPVSEVATYNRF
jgi:putative NAD(P)H nitroreductase